MSLLLLAPDRDMTSWKEALLELDPNLDVEVWPDVKDRKRVQFIVSWKQPENVFSQYPNLKVVSSLGAGVDHLTEVGDLPENVEICRVVSESLTRQMQEYVLMAVLNIQRHMFDYTRQRYEGRWRVHQYRAPDELPVGVMGLGKIGSPVARILSRNGYTINGWANSLKEIKGVKAFSGRSGLEPFLQQSRILVCVLPLTSDTEGILNLELFKKLPHPAYLINVARGEHLVEEDLIYALDKEWIAAACLDVFAREPLPENHPLWNRSEIMITPHTASLTPPGAVIPQILENYKRMLSGQPLLNKVNREKGY